jgi:hypothetical protein
MARPATSRGLQQRSNAELLAILEAEEVADARGRLI